MAFLREYDFRESESLLVEYFYWNNTDPEPALVIRVYVDTFSISLSRKRSYLPPGFILDELRRLFDLLEMPYWKSYVRICSTEHRHRNGDLFV